MKNNKKIKFIVLLIVVTISGYLVGFVYNNYRIIKNHTNIGNNVLSYDKLLLNNFKISDNKLVSTGSNPTINIEQNNLTYLNKLQFNYDTKENIDYELHYIIEDGYGKTMETTLDGNINKHINIFSEKINKKILSLTILFKTSNTISIDSIAINNKLILLDYNYSLFIIGSIAIFLLIYFRKYIKEHLEYLFLILATAGGSIILINHPVSIGKSWDDQIHFTNSYGLVNSNFTEATYELTDNYLIFTKNNFSHFNTTEEKNAFNKYLDANNSKILEDKTNVKFEYNKVAYLHMALAFFIGKIINLPFSLTFSLAMYMNLLLYVTVVFFAIRKTPRYKYLFLTIGLIPTTIFLASSFSYDPPITSFILLGIAYYLYEKEHRKELIKPFNLFIIISSFVIASCPKAVYCPIILLLLTLPKEKFDNNKSRKEFIIMVIIVFLLMMSTFALPILTNNATADLRGGDTSVSRQIKGIIKSPITFTKVYYENAILGFFYKLFDKGTLINYGYMGILKKGNSNYLIILLLILSTFIDSKKVLNRKEKIYMGFILFFMISGIWGSMYLLFTPVGAMAINGVQNRYFIPLLIIFLLMFTTDRIKINLSEEKKYVIYSIILCIITFFPIYYNVI